jgi:hypothetical protein
MVKKSVSLYCKKGLEIVCHYETKKLLEAAEEVNIALMKEMRNSHGQTVPESLDGKVTHDNILDRFREYHEELYNSAGTQLAMDIIKEKLNNQ